MLISCNNKSAYRNEVLSLVNWCCLYNLELNVSKTLGRLSCHWPSMIWRWKEWTSIKFLRTTISSFLKWWQLNLHHQKSPQKSFLHAPAQNIFRYPERRCCSSTELRIESVLIFSLSVWYDNPKEAARLVCLAATANNSIDLKFNCHKLPKLPQNHHNTVFFLTHSRKWKWTVISCSKVHILLFELLSQPPNPSLLNQAKSCWIQGSNGKDSHSQLPSCLQTT